MSVSYHPNSLSLREGGRHWLAKGCPIAVSTLLYTTSIGAIVAGYYGYWIIWKLKVYYFGWAIAFVLALAFAVLHYRDTKGLIRSLFPLLIWEGYLATSTLWAPDPQASLYYESARILFPAAFVIGYVWLRNLSRWQISSYFPITALIQVPIVLWTLVTIGQLYNEELGAVRTGLAEITLMAVPFLVWRAQVRPSYFRYVWIGIAMLVLAASGSRTGAVLGLIVLLGSLTAMRERNRFGMLIKAIAGVLAIGAVGFAVPQVRDGATEAFDKLQTQTAFSWAAWTREDRFLTTEGEQPADRDRRLQVLVAIRSFQTHPIRGMGYYSTLSITQEMIGIPIGAHGLITLLFGETGLIGVAIFIWLIAMYFSRVGSAAKLADTRETKTFWETCRWTMIAMLLFGIFHQVDQTPSFYVLLSWGFAAKY